MVFKQLPLKSTQNLGILKQFSLGLRLLSDVAGGLMLSSDKPIDLHALAVLFVIGLKYLTIGWNTE